MQLDWLSKDYFMEENHVIFFQFENEYYGGPVLW